MRMIHLAAVACAVGASCAAKAVTYTFDVEVTGSSGPDVSGLPSKFRLAFTLANLTSSPLTISPQSTYASLEGFGEAIFTPFSDQALATAGLSREQALAFVQAQGFSPVVNGTATAGLMEAVVGSVAISNGVEADGTRHFRSWQAALATSSNLFTIDRALTANMVDTLFKTSGSFDWSESATHSVCPSLSPCSRNSVTFFGTATYVGMVQAAVPEPSSWVMMISGFGLLGAAYRRRTHTSVAYS